MDLYYRDLGTGQPVIILHGLFGAGDNWMNVAKALSKRCRILLPDMPNHGASAHIGRMDYLSQAQSILEFIDELGIESVALIGHSMGGKTAMTLALEYPERVDRLAIMDIAPRRYEPSHGKILEAMQTVADTRPQSRQEADELLGSLGIASELVRAFLLKSYSTGESPGWKLNFSVIRDEYLNILDWPEYNKVSFAGPTVVVYGTDSEYVEEGDEELFRRLFPSVNLYAVEGAGHWLHAEKPERVISVLNETFL